MPVAGGEVLEEVSARCYHHIAQLLQFIYQPVGAFPFAPQSTLFKTFLTIGRAGFQQSVDDGKNLPGQRNRCPLRSFPLLHLPVPTGKIQLPVRCHDPCNLAEHALQVGITLVDMDTLPLACTLVVAGT